MNKFLIVACMLGMISGSFVFSMEVKFKGGTKSSSLVRGALFVQGSGWNGLYTGRSATALLSQLEELDAVFVEPKSGQKKIPKGSSSDRLSPKERKAIVDARRRSVENLERF